MRNVLIAFAAVALTVTVGVMAQVSGVPSRLRVQSLGVNVTAPSTAGNITAAGTISGASLAGDGSAITNVSAGSIGTGTLAVARGGTGTTTSTGTGSVVLSASPTFTGTVGAATLNATTLQAGGVNVCRSNGTNCPVGRIQGGQITATSAGVCGTAGSYNPMNTTTPIAAGNCTVNWSTAYAAGPICAAAPIATNRLAVINSVTTTSVTFSVTDLAGALVAGTAHIVCFGL